MTPLTGIVAPEGGTPRYAPPRLTDRIQDGSKRPSKSRKKPPREPQELPKKPQDGPKRPQEAPKKPPRGCQEIPKRPQAAPKMAQDGSKSEKAKKHKTLIFLRFWKDFGLLGGPKRRLEAL